MKRLLASLTSVIGRIGLDAGRNLSENRRTGGGGRNGRHGGVAIFRPVVGLAFVEDGSAPVGCCEFERSLLGLFVDVAENLCGEILLPPSIRRERGSSAQECQPSTPSPSARCCEAIGLTQEGGVAVFSINSDITASRKPNGEAHGIGVGLHLVPIIRGSSTKGSTRNPLPQNRVTESQRKDWNA